MGNYQKASTTKHYVDNTKPPKIQDVLHKIITDCKKKHIMPPNPYDAAHWWIDHQEPAKRFRDDPEPIYKDNDITGWKTPYHDRLSYTLRKFLSLSETQQAYIASNVEGGIPWRGDEISQYAGVVDEHKKFIADKTGYIEDAIKRMKKLSFA